MKIAVGLNFYQCVDELKRLLPTLEGADMIYAIDGRHDTYHAENELSNDGSREYLKSFGKVKLFDMGAKKQVEKRSRYFIEAGKDNMDWLIVMDSDLWFIGSWTMLRKNLKIMLDEHPSAVRLWMPHFREMPEVPYIVTQAARLFRYPMFWRYYIRHSNLTLCGVTRKPSRGDDYIVFGLCSRTNKELRKPFRAQEGRDSKIRNNRNESTLAKATGYPRL